MSGATAQDSANACPAHLCLVSPDVTTPAEVIQALGALAVDAGQVDQAYVDAALQREEAHPTGLPTAVPVAIPHADGGTVFTGGFAAALVDPPVPFGQMGGGDAVDVRLVILLMVADREHQVATLGKVLAALQDPELGPALDAVTSPEDLSRVVTDVVAGNASN